MNSILAEIEESIVSKVLEAAEESKAINFAENPLELFTPESVIENAKEAIEGGFNGYITGAGRKPLRKLTSELISKETGVTFDPEEEITITSGASEAFVCSMLSLVEGENGVVIPEPFYENYVPVTELSRGRPIFLSLSEHDYSFHFSDFKKLPTFKVFILNNPHNPTGKVFNSEEIKAIGNTILEREGYLIVDETYKHLLYGGEYISPLRIGDLADRTIVIGSYSTFFSARGWRLGYVAAKAPIMKEIRKVHYYGSVSAPVPFQWAFENFDIQSNYVENLREKYEVKRDFLCRTLEKAGFTFYNPDGGYYVFANFENVWEGNDWGFYKYLLKNKNIAVVPGSAFYSGKNKGKKKKIIFISRSKNIFFKYK